MSYKGFFRPKNPSKYKGDPTNIIYRSSWEVKLMSYLDAHPDVVQWASEELVIPYRSPLDNQIHRYFPDFWVKKRSSDGTIETLVIEVKPLKQTKEPTPSTKRTKQYIREVATWAINQAKWNAAKMYCEDRNWKFMTMTERDLGIKF
jgi:hypothetical protein